MNVHRMNMLIFISLSITTFTGKKEENKISITDQYNFCVQ